jgi:myo-inositol-1(or 4)-monophosphatase
LRANEEARLRDHAADLALIREAAREAGRIALRYFGRDPEVWMKTGQSPVSEADYAVDRFLRETLMAERPHYGWLSEETVDGPQRLSAGRTFVVDPIDGTRAFLAGRETWCVSIAVVEAGRSLAGVLDCPARKELYQAAIGQGSSKNGRPLAVEPASERLRVAGPKDMIARLQPASRRLDPVSYIPSLAYRLAMVADGSIHATFVKPNSHDWDLAAADLILSEAGGLVLDAHGRRPSYAGATIAHGPLVAGSGTLLEELSAVIAVEDA